MLDKTISNGQLEKFMEIIGKWSMGQQLESFEYCENLAKHLNCSIQDVHLESWHRVETEKWYNLRSPDYFLNGQLSFYVPSEWKFHLPKTPRKEDTYSAVITEDKTPRQSIFWMSIDLAKKFLYKIIPESPILGLFTWSEMHDEQGILNSALVVVRDEAKNTCWLYAFYSSYEHIIRITADAETQLLLTTQIASLIKTNPWRMWGWYEVNR